MTSSAPLPSPAAPSDRRRWFALAIVMTAAFMDLVDVTIVNIAIPSIERDTGASFSSIQWIVAGYALAFAAGLITGGRLGDIYGRKRLFLIGIGGFTLASA
ncbi:MFS transporter, partial [Streptomyces rubiginosohelvolus]